MREFTGRASRSQIDRWWDAIQVGITTTDLPALRIPSDSVPPPRAWADKNPAADRRLKSARAAVIEKSGELNIPVENVLTPELLRRLAWAPPEPIELDSVRSELSEMGARSWQVDAVAEPITQAFLAPAEPDVVEPSEPIVDERQTAPSAISDES
jgi:ribonuclease D